MTWTIFAFFALAVSLTRGVYRLGDELRLVRQILAGQAADARGVARFTDETIQSLMARDVAA